MALLAFFMSISLVACSSDDDDESGSSNPLGGTKWRVTVVVDGESFEDWSDAIITFKKNGTVTFKAAAGRTLDFGYRTWSYDETQQLLTLVLGQESADDKLLGTLTLHGKTATWTCYWADVSDWDYSKENETTTLLLTKQ